MSRVYVGPADLPSPRAASKETADGVGPRCVERLRRDDSGDRLCQIVPSGLEPFLAHFDVQIVNASAIRQLAIAVDDERFRNVSRFQRLGQFA